MLRTKQLGTLSHCARSFYLSGSRCGSADGASCTCSEDESCVSKRQSNNTFKQKKGNLVDEAPANAGSTCLSSAIGSIGHHSSGYTASAPHVISSTSSLKSSSSYVNRKINCANESGHASGNDLLHSSKLTAERYVKAGIASVGMFSELVNYRIPAANQHVLFAPQNGVVDSTQPFTTSKSSNSKPRNRANNPRTEPNASANIVGGSNSNSTAQNGTGNKASKAGYVKSKQNMPGTSVMSHGSPVDMKSQRQCIPQREKFHSDSFISDAKPGGRTSEKKVAFASAENIKSANKSRHPMRSTRLYAGASSAGLSIKSGHAVEQYYQTLQQLKWGPTTEEALDNLHFKLDAYQANQVLKLLRDHSVALEFFKWLKCQLGFKHDVHTYTTMIGILGQARQFGAMRRLLDEMIRDGLHPTVVTYNRLIHAYGRANYIGEAVRVFQEMQAAGYEPDRVTYCTLIDIHAKAGFLEVALGLYRQMQEVGLSPDTFTYSAMVNCLGKGGHLAAAYKLFCEMIEQGCVPNLVTYNIMIALQAKARNYTSVMKLYRDMQAAGFRPDKITYSIVMEVYGQCGRLDEAESVFMEMKRDWVPDEPVYGLLVDLWGKAGNVDKARSWYQAMLDGGLQPNVPTCNSLLSAFLKVHRFSDAYDVLQNMLGLGLVPSLQTYTLLLSCCTGTHSRMGLCCQLMAMTGHPAHTFLLSLPDAEPGGQNVRYHASSFLDLMHTEDRESKRALMDAIIDFLHKSGLKEEAGLVWEVAAQRNMYPDSVREKSSSYWLINLHVMSEGTAKTALSRTLAWFHRQMLASGVGLQRIDIITGWGRRSRVTGSSLVRQSVQELLNQFQFPFFTENGNSGCFVGYGESLNRWLLNSYVDRMHLA
ncbi:pentatricopeptide repeat-containing protein At1g74750 isoform X2 [Elaeis guineensis]|uniref:Pentatricopeptide repeat-containing protein At1g74750 isoform X1 n=1 Tax=Elaeis guineensis var. tenera TaxID=51953 RepID=A0A6I9RY95_ELAGV|nr:pentatricopeptide repeat-containing protein At1g74750 isoform X1 [Elaeis guineensis]XP_010933868.1 pentatricopeptide repeat-containing protein At1g74750 isoform X2 [Elaeis guineensis]